MAAASAVAAAASFASINRLFVDEATEDDFDDRCSDDDIDTTTAAMPSTESDTVFKVEFDAEDAIAPR